jgi:tRNA wybutosine-synthesizing protein 3
MDFDSEKKTALSRKDYSKKGSIDEPIKPLVEFINSLPNYYTTSSCSGRILIIERSTKKVESKWLFVSHEIIKVDELLKSICNVCNKPTWFRVEPFIIHICCRDMESASILLDTFSKAGVKRAGLIAFKKRIIIEAFGNERMDTLMSRNGKVLLGEKYITIMIEEANQKITRNLDWIFRLLILLKKELK